MRLMFELAHWFSRHTSGTRQAHVRHISGKQADRQKGARVNRHSFNQTLRQTGTQKQAFRKGTQSHKHTRQQSGKTGIRQKQALKSAGILDIYKQAFKSYHRHTGIRHSDTHIFFSFFSIFHSIIFQFP
jgi:hypothetical protein